MRRALFSLLVLGGFAALAPSSHAQFTNNLNDPFYQYYAWFLPRQAAMAAQPRVNDSINAIAAARSDVAQAERQLYNPVVPYGDSGDPNQSFRREGARGRTPSGVGLPSTNVGGRGDSRYFSRDPYHPGARLTTQGRAPSVPRGRGGMGGMGGMGGVSTPNPVGGVPGGVGR